MEVIIGYVIRKYKERVYTTERMNNEELPDIAITERLEKKKSKEYKIDVFMQE